MLTAALLASLLAGDPPLDDTWMKTKVSAKGFLVSTADGQVEKLKHKQTVYIHWQALEEEGTGAYDFDVWAQNNPPGPWSIINNGSLTAIGGEKQLAPNELLAFDFDPLSLITTHTGQFKIKLDGDGNLKSGKFKTLAAQLLDPSGLNGTPEIEFWSAHGELRVSGKTVPFEKLPFEPTESAVVARTFEPHISAAHEASPPPPGPMDPFLGTWWRVKMSSRGFSIDDTPEDEVTKAKRKDVSYIKLRDWPPEGGSLQYRIEIWDLNPANDAWEMQAVSPGPRFTVVGDGHALLDDSAAISYGPGGKGFVQAHFDAKLKVKLNDDGSIKSGSARSIGKSGELVFSEIGDPTTEGDFVAFFGLMKASLKYTPVEKLPFEP